MIGVITGVDYREDGAVILIINDKPHRGVMKPHPWGWSLGQEVEYDVAKEPYKMPVVSNIRPVVRKTDIANHTPAP